MKQLTNADLVEDFHKYFNSSINQPFKDYKLRKMRMNLINEEFAEVSDELLMKNSKKKDLAKELADLLYVVYGTAVAFGIPIDYVFRLVHESNMSKLGEDGKPIYRKDGKVLKGPNYKPVNLDFLDE